MLFQLGEAQDPFGHEGLVVKALLDNVVEESEGQREIGMRFRGDPFVGLRAGGSEARIDHNQLRFRLRPRAQQVGKSYGLCLGLVGAEKEEKLRRTEVFLARAFVLPITIGEVAHPESRAERVAAGVVADGAHVRVVGRAKQREEAANDRSRAALQPSAGLVGDRVCFAGVAQGEKLLRHRVERLVP